MAHEAVNPEKEVRNIKLDSRYATITGMWHVVKVSKDSKRNRVKMPYKESMAVTEMIVDDNTYTAPIPNAKAAAPHAICLVLGWYRATRVFVANSLSPTSGSLKSNFNGS